MRNGTDGEGSVIRAEVTGVGFHSRMPEVTQNRTPPIDARSLVSATEKGLNKEHKEPS